MSKNLESEVVLIGLLILLAMPLTMIGGLALMDYLKEREVTYRLACTAKKVTYYKYTHNVEDFRYDYHVFWNKDDQKIRIFSADCHIGASFHEVKERKSK